LHVGSECDSGIAVGGLVEVLTAILGLGGNGSGGGAETGGENEVRGEEWVWGSLESDCSPSEQSYLGSCSWNVSNSWKSDGSVCSEQNRVEPQQGNIVLRVTVSGCREGCSEGCGSVLGMNINS